MIPSIFLSGLLVDTVMLPTWAELIGMLLPFHYANNVIQEIITPAPKAKVICNNLLVLSGYIVALLLVASQTLKETD